MKRLILLRHAKSSWDNPGLGDHERPLATRGKKAAPRVGEFIKKKSLFPDLVLCSTAARTIETLDLLQQGAGANFHTHYEPRIYYEDEEVIREIITRTDDTVDSLMIIGHNPDMEELVEILTRKNLPHHKFSTGAIAVIDFDIDNWKLINVIPGNLTYFKTPKMLKKH